MEEAREFVAGLIVVFGCLAILFGILWFIYILIEFFKQNN